MTHDEPIPVINDINEEHTSFNKEEMTNEDYDQAITGVEEQENETNINILEQTITDVSEQENMTKNNNVL